MKRALSVICLAAFTFMACKKDPKDPEPTPTPDPVNIIGYWEGKYIDATKENKEGFFGFLLRADSTVRVYVDQKPGTSTNDSTNAYAKIESTFKHVQTTKNLTFTYFFEKSLSVSGTVSTDVTKVEGTWGEGAVTGRGTFSTTKK